MAILSEYSLWFLMICLFIGAAYAVLLYYKNRNVEFEKRSRIIMAIIRGVVISMIAFLFLAPMVRSTVKQVEKPLILFAVDNSESVVSGKDSVFYRTEYPQYLQNLIGSFGNQYEVATYLIGESDRIDINGGSDMDFSDRVTNLSSFFDDVSTLYVNRNIGALVLMSDGIYNAGSNPYYKAERLRYPVYTVGLGDTELQTDLFISGIQHNRQTFKGNYFPVEIKVSGNKLAGKNAELIVMEKDEVLFTKNIALSSSRYFETVKLSIEAKEKGIHHYRVMLSELEGEVNYKNNVASFFVEVIDSREKIAIVYHAPHPDIAAIKQSLELIDRYEVGVFAAEDFVNPREDYSLVILHQLPSRTNTASSLIDHLFREGISTLFILGEQTALHSFNSLNTGLQITQNRALFNETTPDFNGNFTSFTFSEESRQRIKSFPPLRTFFGEYKSSVSSNTFLYQKINNVATQYPLFLFNDIHGTKTGVITGSGLWQWRIYNYMMARNHDAFNEIIGKTAQLLSVKSDRSFFRVFASQIFDENADVEFSAELYNDSYELVNDPDVMLTVTSEDGRKYDARFSKYQNAYVLNMGKLPLGNYNWNASVQYGNKHYTKQGAFTVRAVELETANLVADHDLLRNISHATDAGFFSVEQMSAIEKAIKENADIKPIATYTKKYGMMLDSWWYFIAIVLLFAVEWFMRKWGGGY